MDTICEERTKTVSFFFHFFFCKLRCRRDDNFIETTERDMGHPFSSFLISTAKEENKKEKIQKKNIKEFVDRMISTLKIPTNKMPLQSVTLVNVHTSHKINRLLSSGSIQSEFAVDIADESGLVVHCSNSGTKKFQLHHSTLVSTRCTALARGHYQSRSILYGAISDGSLLVWNTENHSSVPETFPLKRTLCNRTTASSVNDEAMSESMNFSEDVVVNRSSRERDVLPTECVTDVTACDATGAVVLSVGLTGRTFLLFDTLTMNIMSYFHPPIRTASSSCIHSRGNLLYSGAVDGSVSIFDLRTRSVPSILVAYPLEEFFTTSFRLLCHQIVAVDDDTFISTHLSGETFLYDVRRFAKPVFSLSTVARANQSGIRPNVACCGTFASVCFNTNRSSSCSSSAASSLVRDSTVNENAFLYVFDTRKATGRMSINQLEDTLWSRLIPCGDHHVYSSHFGNNKNLFACSLET